jgi:hypothetical protein
LIIKDHEAATAVRILDEVLSELKG